MTTKIEWTRFTIGRGSDSKCGKWWIMAPGTRRGYARSGVKLFEWDAETYDFTERGVFATYQDARQFAASA